MANRILTIDEFVKKQKEETLSNSSNAINNLHIDEDTEKPKLPTIEEGDFVEDKYGNRYEIFKVTDDFKIADDFDDWEQVSKFKDNKDVLFVIVWAKEDKDKKFVFVYGVEDEHAVRKIDAPDLEGDDKLSKIFKLVCDKLDGDVELKKFKTQWRKFTDMIRAGKIANEKYIMMEILDDFNMSGVITGLNKPKIQESLIESASPSLGEVFPNGEYDVLYKKETYYVKPTVGDTELVAYTDEDMANPAMIDGKKLTFTVKELFGVEKWLKDWIAKVGDEE